MFLLNRFDWPGKNHSGMNNEMPCYGWTEQSSEERQSKNHSRMNNEMPCYDSKDELKFFPTKQGKNKREQAKLINNEPEANIIPQRSIADDASSSGKPISTSIDNFMSLSEDFSVHP